MRRASCRRSDLFAIALCFGAGLGLAPLLPSAHAWTCIDSEPRTLLLIDVSADVEDEALIVEETATWASEAFIDDNPRYTLGFLGEKSWDTIWVYLKELPP